MQKPCGGDGWSKPMQYAAYPGARAGYDYAHMCGKNSCEYTSSASCGSCFSLGLPSILGTVCKQPQAEKMSFGHGMYPGQPCGTCVLVKCVTPDLDIYPQATHCLDTSEFLHMRVDNPHNNSSQEVSDDQFCKRWGCSGSPRVATSAAANNWYEYKEADCATGLSSD